MNFFKFMCVFLLCSPIGILASAEENGDNHFALKLLNYYKQSRGQSYNIQVKERPELIDPVVVSWYEIDEEPNKIGFVLSDFKELKRETVEKMQKAQKESKDSKAALEEKVSELELEQRDKKKLQGQFSKLEDRVVSRDKDNKELQSQLHLRYEELEQLKSKQVEDGYVLNQFAAWLFSRDDCFSRAQVEASDQGQKAALRVISLSCDTVDGKKMFSVVDMRKKREQEEKEITELRASLENKELSEERLGNEISKVKEQLSKEKEDAASLLSRVETVEALNNSLSQEKENLQRQQRWIIGTASVVSLSVVGVAAWLYSSRS